MNTLTNKLSIHHIILLVLAIASLSFGWVAPQQASAQKKDDLCTGANLTFDKTKTSCSSQDGTNDATKTCKNGTVVVDCSESSINNLVSQVINILSIVVGIVAVIMMIYGGFRYITSGGDSGNVSSAKNTILFAIVGLVVVALAQIIVKFVLNKVTT